MAEMKISNTLVNDTQGGVIAYASLLKDTIQNKFQSAINTELYAKCEELSEGTSTWEE